MAISWGFVLLRSRQSVQQLLDPIPRPEIIKSSARLSDMNSLVIETGILPRVNVVEDALFLRRVRQPAGCLVWLRQPVAGIPKIAESHVEREEGRLTSIRSTRLRVCFHSV